MRSLRGAGLRFAAIAVIGVSAQNPHVVLHELFDDAGEAHVLLRACTPGPVDAAPSLSVGQLQHRDDGGHIVRGMLEASPRGNEVTELHPFDGRCVGRLEHG